ncbi:MAG TPA: AAA family ATPase [Bryobacteraceae bacterium]|nr:AAA family ATPase [Bryobacteraceae bacterium]
MYNAFFGFTENPFNMSPDPSFLFRSAHHEEALANLIYGVQSRKGFVVLTGEVGTGKTTMLECLRDFLSSQQITYASLFNSRLNVQEFFEMVAYDFGLRCARTSKTEVLVALSEMIIERANLGRTTVLIVDEAHNLDWDVLEEIRLLGNLENRRGKMLQILLAGQPELDRKLEAPEFRQLKQRIALRCVLRNFQLEETLAYVHYRLRRAGMKDQTVFPATILREIHFRTQGIPRLINAMCDNLLLTAFALEAKTVEPAMVDEVTTDMRLQWPVQRPFLAEDSYAERTIREQRQYATGDQASLLG